MPGKLGFRVETEEAPVPTRTGSPARPTDRASDAAPFAIAALVVVAIAAALLMPFSGLAERQALARRTERANADRWDAAFCEKYGMAPGSERHKACLNDLLDLRGQERALSTAPEDDVP